MKLPNFKKLSGQIKEIGTSESHTLEEMAGRDWSVNIVFLFIIAIPIIIFELVTFFGISEKDFFLNNQGDKKAISIDEEALGRVIEDFSEKEKDFEELTASAPSFPDPSI